MLSLAFTSGDGYLTSTVNMTNLETVPEAEEEEQNLNQGCEEFANGQMKPAFLKHKENIDISQAQHELDKAREEWDQLDSVTPGINLVSQTTIPVSFQEVLHYFKAKDMSEYLKSIKPVHRRRGLSALKRWMCGPPKLSIDLVPERNLIFAIARCPFDNNDPLHTRVLQTVYKQLKGSRKDCPRYGTHWEDIGFQGNDPSTDLRGTGFLGLVHLLYFLLTPNITPLAREIYRLSHHEVQNFPFCVMSINVSRIAIEVLRDEVLNKECNSQKEVIQVVNEFFSGTFLYLYQIWKRKNKTIFDSGYVVKEVTHFAKKNTAAVFQGWRDYILQRKCENETDASDIVNFSDIGNICQ